MIFIKRTMMGIAIGAGAILPGISSGVLCLIFGIYEKLLDSILNFFKDVKSNSKFLFPLIIGGVIGIIIFSKILNFLFTNFESLTKSIFAGLILGCIPSLIKQADTHKTDNDNFTKILNFVFLFSAIFIGFLMVFFENSSYLSSFTQNYNFIYLVFAGFLMSIGVVVPGVSNTIILMLLGVYNIYLSSVANLDFSILIPIAIGLIVGSFIFMKLTKFLLDKCYSQTLFTIIGFTIGSIFVLFPTLYFNIESLYLLLIIVITAFISRKIEGRFLKYNFFRLEIYILIPKNRDFEVRP